MLYNLYKLSQEQNTEYETFDSLIVAASSIFEAKRIIPEFGLNSWTTPAYIKVEFLGLATAGIKQGIILASYNAG